MEIKPKSKKQKIKSKKPDIRYLNEMRKVLYDKKRLKTAENVPLYYMYRGVKKRGNLRYDITVIPPRMLGREFVKTKGHEHANQYGEIYVVLRGHAIYLLQKHKNNRLLDVYAVKAKKDDVVVIPPDYGHITINPAFRELKEANWINKNCKNIYDLFEKKKGAAFYYTKSGWLKNKNYGKIPRLRFNKPLKKMPKNLDFLKG